MLQSTRVILAYYPFHCHIILRILPTSTRQAFSDRSNGQQVK